MNKVVLFVLGFLIGAILMYVLGDFFPRIIIQHTTISKPNNQLIDTFTLIKEVKSTNNREFIEELERVDDAADDFLLTDTLELLDVRPDSVSANLDYEVVRDRLLGKKTVIIQKNVITTASDTSAVGKISDKVAGNSFFNKSLLVEFWESPIDFLGYKLNKNTLVLYGVSPQESIELIDSENGILLLIIDGKNLSLMKTEKYKTLDL